MRVLPHVLGTTQAGLLIAETEFALQVESDIAPYKGLLMGLFFMTVGMEISVGLFFAKIRTVLAGIAGLLLGKVRCCHKSNKPSRLHGMSLSCKWGNKLYMQGSGFGGQQAVPLRRWRS